MKIITKIFESPFFGSNLSRTGQARKILIGAGCIIAAFILSFILMMPDVIINAGGCTVPDAFVIPSYFNQIRPLPLVVAPPHWENAQPALLICNIL